LTSEKNFVFTHTIYPIRLGEFDPGGVLYHARYFHLLEEIREAFLISHQLPYSEITKEGYHLPITHSEQEFLFPIRYGETITGYLAIPQVRKTRIYLYYELHNEMSCVHRASTTLACVKQDNTSFSPSRLPKNLAQIFHGQNSII
jgi:YbgC/YbaW family acyl-CoA thioester hydrolase